MESRQLRYFLAVAECGGFSAAAAKINVAQPALSVQVAKLEVALGCRLFHRHARGITLTPAGHHLRADAIRIVDELTRAEREVRVIGGMRAQDCTIGLPSYAANILAVPLITAVGAALPSINLHILDAMGGVLREWHYDGRLDLTIVYRVPNEPLHDATDLLIENFFVATAKGAGHLPRDSIGIEDLLSIPLVVSTARNAHRQLLNEIARSRGAQLNVAAEIDSLSGQRKLVLMGAGAAVLPLGDFDEWPIERLDLVPVHAQEMIARLLVVRGLHVRNEPHIEVLEKVIVDLVQRLVADGSWRGGRLPDRPHDYRKPREA